jgi:hypothetical protein
MNRPMRAFPQYLDREGSGGVGTLYVYASVHGINTVLEPNYFLAMRDQLKSGDRLRLYQVLEQDVFSPKNRVLAYADVFVVSSSRAGIEFHVTTPATYIEKLEGGSSVSAEAPPASLKTYVSGEPKWKGPVTKWAVVGADGEVLASQIEDKEEAEKIASGELPLPT